MFMNIVISGIGRGIGKAIAIEFLEHGHLVFGCTKSEESKSTILKEIEQQQYVGNLKIITTDISTKNGVEEFSNFIFTHTNSIDVLINNAGVFLGGEMQHEDESQLLNMLDTNLLSAYRLSRKIIPTMLASNKGQIINICSVAGIQGYPNGGSYAISKHAMLGFSRSLRAELQDKNVKVTAIHPGATLTDSWNGIDLPESRFIPVEDIAHLVYHICLLSKYSVVEELVIRPQLGDI